MTHEPHDPHDHQRMPTPDHLDALLHEALLDARGTYNAPSPDPPLDAMWGDIEREMGTAGVQGSAFGVRRRARRLWTSPWLRAAAVLALGIGIGRASVHTGADSTETTFAESREPRAGSAPRGAEAPRPDGLQSPVPPTTTRYLAQTAALLAALPAASDAARADDRLVRHASDLLLTTRLLLDSPAANDPALRNLLEDLELVLAQVARLPEARRANPAELDLIRQAVDQRDVLPRLRSAVVERGAD